MWTKCIETLYSNIWRSKTAYTYKQLHCSTSHCSLLRRPWVSNWQPTRLYYVVCTHIRKLYIYLHTHTHTHTHIHTYNKNYIVKVVRYTTYFDFYTWPMNQLFSMKRIDTHEPDVLLNFSSYVAVHLC